MLSIEVLTLLQAIRETGSLSRAWAKRLLPCPAVQGSDRFVSSQLAMTLMFRPLALATYNALSAAVTRSSG